MKTGPGIEAPNDGAFAVVPEAGLHPARMTPYAIGCVAMASATIMLDGLDNQVLGLAAPSLIDEWGVTRGELGTIFALGFLGMAVGSAAMGWLGDRVGRRYALLLGVVVFGAATTLTGAATAISQIAILRVVAGLGLGGVPGAAAALIAEYTPLRLRGLTVTIGVVCSSLGGIVGSLASSIILPALGWRWLFYLGGVLPLAATLLLAAALPESPEYLARDPRRHGELERLGHRLAVRFLPTRGNAPGATFVPTRALFAPEMRRDTAALSGALFVGLFLIYMMYNWAPTLLYSNGFSLPRASSGLTSFNLGGVLGAVIAALLVMRFGSRLVLGSLGILAVLISIGLSLLPIDGPRNVTALLAALFLLGLTGSAVQSSIYALGAHAFPMPIRARGIGIMAAAGRIGAILSAVAGAIVARRGSFAFFALLAVVMLVNSACLALVRRHIARPATT